MWWRSLRLKAAPSWRPWKKLWKRETKLTGRKYWIKKVSSSATILHSRPFRIGIFLLKSRLFIDMCSGYRIWLRRRCWIWRVRNHPLGVRQHRVSLSRCLLHHLNHQIVSFSRIYGDFLMIVANSLVLGNPDVFGVVSGIDVSRSEDEVRSFIVFEDYFVIIILVWAVTKAATSYFRASARFIKVYGKNWCLWAGKRRKKKASKCKYLH